MRFLALSIIAGLSCLSQARFVLDDFNVSQSVALSGPTSSTISHGLAGSRRMEIGLNDPLGEAVVNPGASAALTLGAGKASLVGNTEYGVSSLVSYTGTLPDLTGQEVFGLRFGNITGPVKAKIWAKSSMAMEFVWDSPVFDASHSFTEWKVWVAPSFPTLNLSNLETVRFTLDLAGGPNSAEVTSFFAEPVPEPATLLVVGAGLGLLARRRRLAKA